MFDPLAPAPRLPEDTTIVLAISEQGLGAAISTRLGGPHQLSLIQTQTPTKWHGAGSRAVYEKRMVYWYMELQELDDVVRPVLVEFGKDNPKPPQNRGKNS